MMSYIFDFSLILVSAEMVTQAMSSHGLQRLTRICDAGISLYQYELSAFVGS
ncbi:hypothetical protein [Calothrix sp. UHCC 0171]|uniref:hypothetical protein n=1 Tax=Calothrix sp. UHCC 0171 TaxID=3110245 RepID=UPI002B213016|nr:hypothetical protein [Calothrix sp. UHCC 0171]MEA5569959.1 hypothetical protein [Calothrix sp. UHCC 0171]